MEIDEPLALLAPTEVQRRFTAQNFGGLLPCYAYSSRLKRYEKIPITVVYNRYFEINFLTLL